MTLAELLKWHRRQLREADDACVKEVHRDAVQLLDGIIKRKAAHDEHRRNAVAKAIAAGKKPGRARIDPEVEDRIRAMLTEGASVRRIMAEVGCGSAVIYRIKAEMAAE
jgi:hypothetical protein